jgi:hypothetical protein
MSGRSGSDRSQVGGRSRLTHQLQHDGSQSIVGVFEGRDGTWTSGLALSRNGSERPKVTGCRA